MWRYVIICPPQYDAIAELFLTVRQLQTWEIPGAAAAGWNANFIIIYSAKSELGGLGGLSVIKRWSLPVRNGNACHIPIPFIGAAGIGTSAAGFAASTFFPTMALRRIKYSVQFLASRAQWDKTKADPVPRPRTGLLLCPALSRRGWPGNH